MLFRLYYRIGALAGRHRTARVHLSYLFNCGSSCKRFGRHVLWKETEYGRDNDQGKKGRSTTWRKGRVWKKGHLFLTSHTDPRFTNWHEVLSVTLPIDKGRPSQFYSLQFYTERVYTSQDP